MINKLLFAKVKQNAIIPTKELENAGYDLYANFEETELVIEPNEIRLISTGISTAFDYNYVFIVKERGSTGSIGMSVRMGVVDSGFRGEINIGINNTSDKTIIISKEHDKVVKTSDIIIYPYTKAIAQGILTIIPDLESEEISYEELLTIKSNRMDNWLGSSNK